MVPAFGMVILPQNPSTGNGQVPGCSCILSVVRPQNATDFAQLPEAEGYPPAAMAMLLPYAAEGAMQQAPQPTQSPPFEPIGHTGVPEQIHAKNKIVGRSMPFSA